MLIWTRVDFLRPDPTRRRPCMRCVNIFNQLCRHFLKLILYFCVICAGHFARAKLMESDRTRSDLSQWLIFVVKYGGHDQSGQAIKLFQIRS